MVGEIRGVGMIAAVELVMNKKTKSGLEKPGALGLHMNKALQRNGIISRAIVDAAALCPPLITKRNQINEIITAISKSLDEVQAEVS